MQANQVCRTVNYLHIAQPRRAILSKSRVYGPRPRRSWHEATRIHHARRASAAWPLGARAQQPRLLGWLVGLAEQEPEAQRRKEVVIRALRDLGWVVGRNLHIDYRYTIEDGQRFDAQAAELIALAPDVLLANSTPATRALQQATSTIPIVFALVPDPVGSGVVTSLARPGGNVTGFTISKPAWAAEMPAS